MTIEIQTPSRRVKAVMMRAQSKDPVMVRTYSYMDTAMPRMLQLAMTYCNEGDFIEFSSIEFGWQLGIMRMRKGGQISVEISDMVRNSPSLLKLMSEDPQFYSRYL